MLTESWILYVLLVDDLLDLFLFEEEIIQLFTWLMATVVSSHWRLSFADIQGFPCKHAHGAINSL